MTRESLIFKTPYGEHESKPIPAGTEMENEYGYEINKKGQRVLVKTGETNLHEKIQADLEECKIENILQATAQGDMTHFSATGIYADVAEMPKTLIEARQQINALENMWNTLPMEIKEHYNHDVEEFVGASGTDRWLEDMGIIGAEIAEPDATLPEAPVATALGQIKEDSNES